MILYSPGWQTLARLSSLLDQSAGAPLPVEFVVHSFVKFASVAL